MNHIKFSIIFWLLLVFFIFVLLSFVSEAKSFDEMVDILVERGLEINSLKIKYDSNLHEWDRASRKDIEKRIYWLGYYSRNRGIYSGINVTNDEYHWKRLWKDSVAIVWQESWFVNYRSQDDGMGFGWGALHWNHCETLSNKFYRMFDYTEDKFRMITSDRLQAQYIIGNLLMMFDHYGNRGQAILGYNKGFHVGNNYMMFDYFNDVSGKINTIQKWLDK